MKVCLNLILTLVKSFGAVLLMLLTTIGMGSTLISCEQDPEIITKIDTLTVIDTVLIVDTFTVIETIIEHLPDTTTTFILVRHAETTGAGANPNLSAAGQARAQELSRIMTNVDLNAVFSSDYNRTKQTAQPTATAKGLPVTLYDPLNPNVLIDQTLINYRKGIVLVVGHSNTTAAMLNAMVGANTYPDIAETEYDNMFIVQITERGKAKVLHFKYGQ